MVEAYRKEFDELSALAGNNLRHPKVQPPHHRPLLRLWCYPSFERWTSWLVYVPVQRLTQPDSPIVAEVTWDRPFDVERFTNPLKGLAHGLSSTPTITLKQAGVPSEMLNSQLLSLEQISVPVMVHTSLGLDGEECGLETFGMAAAVRLIWQSNIPEAWQPVVRWAEELRTLLRSCLADESVSEIAI
jgi:hypothetical protein